jgi:hypothetical protein
MSAPPSPRNTTPTNSDANTHANTHDTSNNDASNNHTSNVIDVSFTDVSSSDVSYLSILNQTLLRSETGPGYVIDVSTNEITFTTTIDSSNVNIYEDLSQNIVMLDDNESILAQIQACAVQIKCENFHGKGSIDDYAELFAAASQIANQTSTISLDVDIEGFNEFASAADELSALFHNFTTKLKTINIIDDTAFLRSILVALQKIVNLSNTFAKFKETILATNTIEIPQSIYKSSAIISSVSDEVDCAMQYINNFVTPDANLEGAALSAGDKLIIQKAATTIQSWNSIVEHGVSVTMSNNPSIQYISQQNANYFTRANNLKAATLSLKNKFSSYNLK